MTIIAGGPVQLGRARLKEFSLTHNDINLDGNSLIDFSRLAILTVVFCLATAACSERTTNSAVGGAARGGLSGAVGGFFSSLVFGGDVATATARGAVYGAGVGGTYGAISGSIADDAAAKRREAEEARIKKKIGDDAFAGLAALATCKHSEARSHAQKAQQSTTPDFALAGLWLEILTLADERQEATARTRFPMIINADPKVANGDAAEARMREGLEHLREIRKNYELPVTCKV